MPRTSIPIRACLLTVLGCTAPTDATHVEAVTLPCPTSPISTHAALCDSGTKLVSWAPVASHDLAYDYIVNLTNQYFVHRPTISVTDRNGQNPKALQPWYGVSYLCSGESPNGCSPAGSPVGWPQNDAGLAEMLTESGLRFYAYNGDTSLVGKATELLTHHLDHASSASSDSWSLVPYTDGTPGEYDFSGNANSTTGVGDGAGYLEPEKVAALGYAYALAYEYSGTTRFRDAAVHIANQLHAHQRTTGLSSTVSPWPFRVRASDNTTRAQAGEKFASNVVDPLLMYTEVIALGDAGALAGAPEFTATALANWRAGKSSALAWLLGPTGPILDSDHSWCQYFEDVAAQSDLSNLNQLVPMETAKYLMDHPDDDPSWQSHVASLLAWVRANFGGAVVNGARTINEQQAFLHAMGSHTSRYAAVSARYYELTGDQTARDEAFRSFNWATYMVHADGLTIDGPTVQNVWFSDGWGDFLRHFFIGMGAVPDWAPAGRDHILRTSSVVRSVTFAPAQVNYQTFAASGREVLRLGFVPTSVTAGGVALAQVSDLATSQGWTFDSSPDQFGHARNVLRIRHDNAGTLVIRGTTTAPTVTVTSPAAAGNFAAPATLALSANVAPAPGRTIASGAVRFSNGATLLCAAPQTTSPFSCTATTSLPDGSYVVSASATDSAGESTTATVNVTVSNAPVVAITSPANGATVGAGAVVLRATTSAGTGRSIASVVFKAGATTLCTATASPWQCTWAATVGSYAITAVATDNGTPALATTSSPVTVTVSSTGSSAVILGSNPQTVPSTTDFEDAQVADFWPMIASGSGTVDTLHLYVDAANTAAGVRLGIYANGSNTPTTLLTSCSASATAGTAGWITCAPTPSVSLVSGTSYWFAILDPVTGTSVHWREQSGAGGTYSHSSGGQTALPATAPAISGTYPGQGIVAYAATSGAASPPPTAALTSPANNANFSAPANLALQATVGAAPDRTLTKVEVFQVGITAAICTQLNPSSSSVTCGISVGDGTYSYYVRATDDLGQTGTSSTVTITVSNPPAVTLASPADGATLDAGAISLAATATAGTGRTIASVTFRSGTTTLCTATASPWTCAWNAGAGSYTVAATATDSANPPGTATSAAIHVTVVASSVPAAPSALVATASASSQIDLSWVDNATNETGYQVERAPDNAGTAGAFAVIATLTANTHTFASTGLAAATRYWYRVRATGAAGPSGYSNTASATTSGGSGTVLVGNNAVASVADSDAQGNAEAFRFAAIASGTVHRLYLYVGAAGATSVQVGLYGNSGSVPGARLASCTIAAPTANAWNSCALAAGTSVAAGTVYWLAVLGTAGGAVHFVDSAGSGTNSYDSSASNLTSLPATYAVGTGYASAAASMYGTN